MTNAGVYVCVCVDMCVCVLVWGWVRLACTMKSQCRHLASTSVVLVTFLLRPSVVFVC